MGRYYNINVINLAIHIPHAKIPLCEFVYSKGNVIEFWC